MEEGCYNASVALCCDVRTGGVTVHTENMLGASRDGSLVSSSSSLKINGNAITFLIFRMMYKSQKRVLT